jgi:hypothetical protein
MYHSRTAKRGLLAVFGIAVSLIYLSAVCAPVLGDIQCRKDNGKTFYYVDPITDSEHICELPAPPCLPAKTCQVKDGVRETVIPEGYGTCSLAGSSCRRCPAGEVQVLCATIKTYDLNDINCTGNFSSFEYWVTAENKCQ